MHNSITFTKDADGFYDAQETENLELLVMALFLMNDFAENEQDYFEWIEESYPLPFQAECTTISQDAQNNIYIECEFDNSDENNDESDNQTFTIKVQKENFSSLLAAWSEILATDPQEIELTCENSLFKATAKSA